MAEQEARGIRPCLEREDARRPNRAINRAVPDSPRSLWLGYEVTIKYRRNTIDLMTDSLQSLCLALYKDRQDRVANSACAIPPENIPSTLARPPNRIKATHRALVGSAAADTGVRSTVHQLCGSAAARRRGGLPARPSTIKGVHRRASRRSDERTARSNSYVQLAKAPGVS